MFRSKMLEVRERKNIMKNIMKTISRSTRLIIILAFLPALLSAAQVQAVTYQTKYKNAYQGAYVQTPGNASATTASPSVGFQSTSAFSDEWNTAEGTTPMLNSDGTVNESAYMSSLPGRSIRKSGNGSGYNPGTPDEDEEEEGEQQPLGDVMLPMMMLLCAYAIYKVSRKQSFKSTGKEQLE